MTDTRQVIQAHSIGQWFALDESTRSMILQNIKLKDRLWRFLFNRNAQEQIEPLKEPKWAPCKACDTKGWVVRTPRYPGIHPSQIAHSCLLKIYKDMIGADKQEKVEPRGQLIFDVGTAIHIMLQNYGKAGAWGPLYRDEVEISGRTHQLAKDLLIEGHVDAENILTIDDPNLPYIFEVGLVHEYKTINTNGFEKLTKPKPEHKTQALIYSAILDRPVTAYLYFNKNDSNLADFPVPFDASLWDPIVKKCQALKGYLESPTGPEGSPGYHCKDCHYVFNCEAYMTLANKISKGK